jgi:hypothetical protein
MSCESSGMSHNPPFASAFDADQEKENIPGSYPELP